jgi:hypothetical protein
MIVKGMLGWLNEMVLVQCGVVDFFGLDAPAESIKAGHQAATTQTAKGGA